MFGWNVEKFSKDQIALYQEVNQTCPQHFELIDENGIIVIYQANEKGSYQLVDRTEIHTKYLSEEDQKKLKEGIQMIGEEKLNSILEDYE